MQLLTMRPTSAKVKFRRVLVAFSMFAICQTVLSDLTSRPMDSESLVNESTFFNCSSSITTKEIHWYHYPVGTEAHERKTVYAFNKFYQDYMKDFEIDENLSIGVCNLVIRSVKPSYSGRYECQDDGGQGNTGSAQLIVLDAGPGCISNMNPDGLIGPNACGILPEELHLSCSVDYHGNIPPQLKWRRVGENDSISENVMRDQLANRVTYNVTVRADLLVNNASYECQTTHLGTSKHSCTSERLKLLYIYGTSSVSEKSIGDVVHCSANTSSQYCQYKWKWNDGEKSLTLSNNQTVKLERTGLYWCEATCRLSIMQCAVNASLVNASQTLTDTGSETTGGSLMWLAVVVPVVVVIFVVLLVVFIICHRRNRKHKAPKADVEDARKIETHALIPGATEDNPIVLDPEEDKVKFAKEIQEEEHPGKRQKTDEPRNKESIDCDQNPTLLHVQSFNCAENEKTLINGLTMLHKELFVVFENNSEVKVYQAITFSHARSFAVEELDNPLDIVSSPLNNCLYISSPYKMYRINANGKVIGNWEIEDGGTLSITANQTVLLSVFQKAALREYSADGAMYVEVKLPSDVHPFHAVKISVDRFVVSYERGMMQHYVGTVDTSGHIIQSFSEMLKFPKYLAVNSDGFIFVAEQKNGRVLRMCPTLKSTKVILFDKDKFHPLRIYLDEENSQMFVVDVKSEANSFMVFTLPKQKTEDAAVDIPVNQDKSLELNGNLGEDQNVTEDYSAVYSDASNSEDGDGSFLDARQPLEESRGEEPRPGKRKR